MTESLRDRQKLVARELILQAAADEIVEKGLEDLSLQVVADRAGVSKRTLYNYFDSREALLEGVCDWSDQLTLQMGGYLVPGGLDSLPDLVAPVWRTWKAQGSVYEASMRIVGASSSATASAGRVKRRGALVRAVADVRPDLSTREREELAALLHLLISAPVYQRLTIEDGIDLETAARLVSWAIAALRDSIITASPQYPKEELP